MTFSQGQRVTTPLGLGTVAYQRLAGPDYTAAEAVSVVLDDRRERYGYTGTLFAAYKVTPCEPGEPQPSRSIETVRLSDVAIGDELIDSADRPWFRVTEVRVSTHAPARKNRLVVTGLNDAGLSYSHNALKTATVRRYARTSEEPQR
jgi:hypothetical protein